MDIPRRKEREAPDKLTSELLFFCTWITRGWVPIDALTTFCPHSDGSYYRYATDLYLCGAVPPLHIRNHRYLGRPDRCFVCLPSDKENWLPMRFDMESQHLQRLARMVCLLGTADVSLCLSRWGDGPGHSYPPYPPLYADLDERTFYRDKKLAEKVLYTYKKDYDAICWSLDDYEIAEDLALIQRTLKRLRRSGLVEDKWDDEEIL